MDDDVRLLGVNRMERFCLCGRRFHVLRVQGWERLFCVQGCPHGDSSLSDRVTALSDIARHLGRTSMGGSRCMVCGYATWTTMRVGTRFGHHPTTYWFSLEVCHNCSDLSALGRLPPGWRFLFWP